MAFIFPGETNMKELFDAATRMGEVLKEKGWLMTTAESCTGGGVAQAVTDIPGSSEWYEGGFISYSNIAKSEMLDVPPALIAQFGAVSEEVAAAMAEGALANSSAHVSVSTTGIAGPTGAVSGKPVGTVCFAWSIERHGEPHTFTERLVFKGDRQAVRQQSVLHALEGLVRFIGQQK
jgi:nicotinamide-nucleotide amidase